jgi:large subunit ribosomal protein L15
MELLSQLGKTTTKQKRRIGRGYGCKKGGHTSGRGHKGDKGRGSTPALFDGTKIKKGWIKRLPFLRGKHRVLAKTKPQVINLDYLEKNFKDGDTVTFNFKAKIVSTGKITKKLIFKNIPMSATAKMKLEAVGATIE